MTTSEQVRAAIAQLAAEWYIANRTGPLPDAKRGEFLAWLKSSPVHIEEYLAIAAIDRVLPQATANPRIDLEVLIALARDDYSVGVVGKLPEFPAGKGADRQVQAPRQVRAPRRVQAPRQAQAPRRMWLRLAAVGMSSIAAIWLLWPTLAPHGGSTTPPRTYQTARGVQGSWPLPDGSTLRLDTDTAVTVRFSPTGRVLELSRGQLWMAVAHDVHRPLKVEAGTAEIIAVGTEFDVYRMADTTRVTVINGKVTVSVKAAPQRTLYVAADQEVQIIDGVLPAATSPARKRETTAWLQRRIVFERRPLGEVADEFNRYNTVPFTIDDPGLRRLPISGAFDAADTDSFASFLQSLTGVRVERQPTAFKISASRK
jgi:transmembrane sensor